MARRRAPALGGVLDRVIATLQPCVARSQAISLDGSAVRLRCWVCPSARAQATGSRFSGAILPLEDPRWLGHVPLHSLVLQNASLIWTEPSPARGRPSVKPPNRRARQRRLHRHPGWQEQVLTQALPGRRSIDPSSFPPHPLTRHLRIESHKPRKTAFFQNMGELLVNTSSTPKDSAAGLGEAGGGTATLVRSSRATKRARASAVMSNPNCSHNRQKSAT